MSSDHGSEPFILYPWKVSDVGPIGYIKLPAQFFEPVYGAWWLYDYRTNAAQHERRDMPTTLSQVYTSSWLTYVSASVVHLYTSCVSHQTETTPLHIEMRAFAAPNAPHLTSAACVRCASPTPAHSLSADGPMLAVLVCYSAPNGIFSTGIRYWNWIGWHQTYDAKGRGGGRGIIVDLLS